MNNRDPGSSKKVRHLPVVIESVDTVMRCYRLQATVRAGTCVERQQRARTPGTTHLISCRNCSQGQSVVVAVKEGSK